MHVRMIPKSNADIKFADVATRQPEYEVDNISGTIVGIWTPEMFHGVSVAGYHLHFISDDLTFGGHVMDFVIENGIIEVGIQLTNSTNVSQCKTVSIFLLNSMSMRCVKILLRLNKIFKTS